MECLQLIRPFSSSVVLAVQSTCVSFVPLSASTGHFIFDNCLPTLMVMKWRMYVLSACCNAFAIMAYVRSAMMRELKSLKEEGIITRLN